jgi:hypothetical protein
MQRLISKIILFLIGLNFFYVLSGAIHYPLASIDVYSIWLLKAKAFYVYNGFPLEFLQNIGYSHPHYPVFLPWFFSLIYKIIGGVNEYYVLVLYPFVYLVILFLACRFFTKIGLSKTISLFFVYIYSMLSPLLAQGGRYHAGLADIVLVLLYWIGILVAYEIARKKGSNFVWVLVLIVAIASQIKLEGVFFAWTILFFRINNNNQKTGQKIYQFL